MMSTKISDFLTLVHIWIFIVVLNSRNLLFYVRFSMTPLPPLMRTSYLEAP